MKYKAKRTSAASFLLRLIHPCGGMWAVTVFVITGLSTGGILADAHPTQANLFIGFITLCYVMMLYVIIELVVDVTMYCYHYVNVKLF